MEIVEALKNHKKALKVSEVAKLLGVTPQHIYQMLASGKIPGAFRLNNAIRFDPDIVAEWLTLKLTRISRGPALLRSEK